jgi:hypothetical protein
MLVQKRSHYITVQEDDRLLRLVETGFEATGDGRLACP